VRRLAGITAITGLEQSLADTILALLPGARRDRAGNAVLTLGAGTSRRLIACPLDEPGYVVGHVREDGFLTLRRSPGQPSRGRDAQLEGQRVTISASRGPVPGVVAVRSVHLTRGRADAPTGFTVDSALIDVGATSAGEVEALGIGVLDPVVLTKRPHRYGAALLAAPAVGRRAACAALLLAARRAAAGQGMIPRRQAIVVAFVVEQELSARGLATVASSAGPFEETLLLQGEATASGELAARLPALGRVTTPSLPVRYGGTPVETVALTDVDRLAADLVTFIRTPR
jgi:putative aminopeptidase